MTKRVLLVCLVSLLPWVSGCSLFRKSSKPKESSALSSEVEATFRQRWVDRRVAELNAQGIKGDAARTQAMAEFQEKYAYMGGEPKK
jgi:hypothetical protein